MQVFLQGLSKYMQIIAILCVLEILIEILYNIPFSFKSMPSIAVLSIHRYLLQYFAILQKELNLFMF